MAHIMHRMVDTFQSRSEATLLKPLVVPRSNPPKWFSVSYGQFLNLDVVGIWLTGHDYTDAVHIYGLCLAGYVPQVFSVWFAGVAIVGDLLTACEGKALIYDKEFSAAVTSDIDLPSFVIPTLEVLSKADPGAVLPPLPDVEGCDTAMIFHTSGTTGGRPKPVPGSHAFFDAQAKVQWPGVTPGSFDSQNVYNNLGSFAHIGTASSLSYLSYSGHCLVQTTKAQFDADELKTLVKECGVNRLFYYAPWLSTMINIARTDPEILDILRNMRQIMYTGAAFNPEDEAWVIENNLPVTAMYATTEVGPSLISDFAAAKTLPSMRIVPGLGVQFLPVTTASYKVEGDNEERSDLFEEVRPGWYIFRGRNDDWIRIINAFCDTKSIEDNVMTTCADIVYNCTVVGHDNPAPVLFVEPVTLGDEEVFKRQILERTAAFNAEIFPHERITSPEYIVVVPKGNLPRTSEKGNIRRKAVMDEHGEKIYASRD